MNLDQFITKNFTHQEQDAFARGLKPGDLDAIKNNNISGLSDDAARVIYSKIDQIKALHEPSSVDSAPAYIGKSILAGLLSGGRDIANLPHTLFNKIPALASTQPDYYEKILGIRNPGIGAEILEGIGQLPFYIAGAGELSSGLKAAGLAPKLADLIGIGGTAATLGAASSPDSPAAGAAIGVGSAGLGAGLGKVLSSGIKGSGKYLLKPLTDKISDKFSKLGSRNAEAFSQIQNNYKSLKDLERNAWDKLGSSAEGLPFDSSSYKSRLSELKNNLLSSSKGQKTLEKSVSPIIEEINDLINSPVNTMDEAIAHRKAINSIIGGTKQAGQSKLTDTSAKQLVKALHFGYGNQEGIKPSFDRAINDNLNNSNISNEVKESWGDANNLTKLVKSFEEKKGLKGKSEPTAFYSLHSRGITPEDSNEFIKDYTDLRGGGTARFKELANMLRDEDKARAIIKDNLFKSSIDADLKTKGLKASKFYSEYNKLTDSQKDYLFKGKQRSDIDTLFDLYKKYPDLGNYLSRIGYFAAMHSPGGALGGYTGYKLSKNTGFPEWAATLAGISAGEASQKSIESMLGEIASRNPKVADIIISKILNPKTEKSISSIARQSAFPSQFSQYLKYRKPMDLTLTHYLRKEDGSN
jgi:hypothetical protein